MVDFINKITDKVLSAFHISKFKEQVMYLIVGGLTTAVDWIVFTLFAMFIPPVGGDFIEEISPNILAYTISWLVAVLFSYFASRLFVFKPTEERVNTQLLKFVGSRIVTLVISIVGDIILSGKYAVISVKNPWIAKLIISVFVIIINYVTSKWFVFSKKRKERAELGDGENSQE